MNGIYCIKCDGADNTLYFHVVELHTLDGLCTSLVVGLAQLCPLVLG